MISGKTAVKIPIKLKFIWEKYLSKQLIEYSPTVIFLSIFTVSIVLRLWGLGSWSFIQDELYTLRDSNQLSNINPLRPVYYVLQSVLLEILPSTEFGARVPAAFFGILGVVVIWIASRNMFNNTVAFVASSLTCLSAWHLFMSQYARYWSMLFVLITLVIWLLPKAFKRNVPIYYILSNLLISLGIFTHPTFIFPVVGIMLSVIVSRLHSNENKVLFTKQAYIYLITPLFIVTLIWIYLVMQAQNSGIIVVSRDLEAIDRILPAIIQRTGPGLFIATLISIIVSIFHTNTKYRNFGITTALGIFSTLGLLFFSSSFIDVYADYAFVMLPLVFLSVGLGIQILSSSQNSVKSKFATTISISVILIAGLLPSTLSHMRDGSRLDYKSAYNFIDQNSSSKVVFADLKVIQKYYAPDASFHAYGKNFKSFLHRIKKHDSFWLIAAYRRRGIVNVTVKLERWIENNCRLKKKVGKQRFDYRDYKIKIFMCHVKVT